MCVRRIFKMVHKRNEEAGNEASKREQNGTHSKAGKGQPEKGPIPVNAAVRPLEHPVKPNKIAPWILGWLLNKAEHEFVRMQCDNSRIKRNYSTFTAKNAKQ